MGVVALVLATLSCSLLAPPRCAASTEDYCAAKDPSPFASFATRTPYQASGANVEAVHARLEGCRPVHLWLLGRHGTRHGKAADIELILRLQRLQPQVRGNKEAGRTIRLCDADLDGILQWQPEVDKSMSYQLTPQGQVDMLNMGERYRTRFPDLFQNAADIEFKYDSSDRCIDSSRWFYKGIFGEFPAHGEGKLDPLPDFYNRCPAYLTPIATDFIMGDFNKFKKGAEWADMTKRVSDRLGFYRNLDVGDVEAMYTACSFERARNWEHGKHSPWCAAFRPADFEVLEYWYDMKEYYRTGYGHKIHEKLGCVAIKNLVKSLSERVGRNSASSPSGVVYHSHDTLLNQVIAFLGLHRDAVSMREDTFQQLRQQRQWRVSTFSPFASNLAAVLYECPDDPDRHRVQMFLNENPLPMSDWGCDADSCTLAQFSSKFGHVLSDCKQRRLCWGL